MATDHAAARSETRAQVLLKRRFFFSGSPDGLLVTCAHVTKDAMPLGVELPDETDATVASLVAADSDSDLVLLRIAGSGFKALPLAEDLAEPHDLLLAVTKDGNVPTNYLGPGTDPDIGHVILFNAGDLGVGASGGALLDGRGRVVDVILGGHRRPARRGRGAGGVTGSRTARGGAT